MTSWDDDFRNLQVEFLRGGAQRLADIDGALGRLAAGDQAALADLKRHTHRLTGSGATYERPGISDAAREGERRCDVLLSAGAAPSSDDFVAWREMRARLEEGFADPLAQLRAASVHDAAADPAVRVEPEPRILVVDGDPLHQERLRGALGREGIGVTLVMTVKDARAEIDAWLPDGLIVDRLLADGTGYDVIQHLRERAGGDAPAALMLASGDMLDVVEAIHTGADACYLKPGETDMAVRKLVQMLERTRAEAPRILVVEDDEFHAAFARAVLESAGYTVEVCQTPRQFHDHMATFHPELILMDVNMPDVSGYDLARIVRQQERHAALPIIFVTSEGEMEARIEAARSGGDEHLTKPVHPALLASAVGARVERARLLRTLLHRDGLTRLLTHASFMEQVQLAVDRRNRGHVGPASLVMLDVDHFKAVNDTHGHQAGDRVLVALSSLLRRHLRRTDTIGRYGGEEFGILLDQLDEPATARLVQRLLDEFRGLDHTSPDGVVFRCTFSAGVAELRHGMDRHRWLDGADATLYRAKRAGRDRVMCASAAAAAAG